MSALRALLSGIVDFAGLFPPAALSMTAAVAEYAGHRLSPEAGMLGRFVVSAQRLPELALAASPYLPPAGASPPWRISALLGEDPAADVRAIQSFNAAVAERAVVDTVEGKASRREDVDLLLGAVPGGFTVYVEVPLEPDPSPLLTTLAARGARAKVRTGGLSAEAVPTPLTLARFLGACVAHHLPFKATAGLHHPVRSEQAFTCAPDSPRGIMHGFLNVFVAAVLLREGGLDAKGAEALLRDERRETFRFDGETLRVGSHTLDAGVLESARNDFAMSFGSCSFADPVTDLRALGLRPETVAA